MEIVYLRFVNSTMQTVVVLIEEQAELQRSQVGWKNRGEDQPRPDAGTALSHVCSRAGKNMMLCNIN